MKKNKINLHCTKKNHTFKECNESIVSYGIMLFKLFNEESMDISMKDMQFSDISGTNKEICNTKISIKNNSNIRATNQKDILMFSEINNNFKFLMVRRKHTLGYIEFIRGRYRPENPDGIIFLFQQMTQEEINDIGKHEFLYLWNNFWGESDKKKMLDFEYNKSREKFYALKNGHTDIDLNFYVENVKPSWNEPEWGFPKGRKNRMETDLECAKREFEEETGFCSDDYFIFDNIDPLVEDLIGTNGLKYRHIYYVAVSKTNKVPEIDNKNLTQINEIGAIEYFTYCDCLKIIRPHHIAKKSIVTNLYNHIVNNIIVNKNK